MPLVILFYFARGKDKGMAIEFLTESEKVGMDSDNPGCIIMEGVT